MKKQRYIKRGIILSIVMVLTIFTLTGCDSKNSNNSSSNSSDSTSNSVASTEGVVYTSSDLFTSRDLEQTADTTNATKYIVSDGEDIHITEEGVYVLTGTAKNVTIYVEVDSEVNVQLVLDGVSITNTDFPCIYVKTANKVFITTTDSKNTLNVTGTFKTDENVNTDGAIFSLTDLVLNGKGTITIDSTSSGIVSKDGLKITGGTYNVTAKTKAIEANDSIRISDGTFTLNARTDGLHAENEDDDSLGYIYIGGGKFTIVADDDGIHGVSVVQIDDGTFNITASEGIEGTYVQINGGTININGKDDGINAAKKSSKYSTKIEINSGNITITMASGDTDGIDSNGDIIVNGGTINVTGSSTFDYDGNAEFNGGTIIVNGTEVDTIPNQMMGGANGGNRGGMQQGRRR